MDLEKSTSFEAMTFLQKRDGRIKSSNNYYTFLDFYLGEKVVEPIVWGESGPERIFTSESGRLIFNGTIIVKDIIELAIPEVGQEDPTIVFIYCDKLVFEGGKAAITAYNDMSFHANTGIGYMRFESLNHLITRPPGEHGMRGTRGLDAGGVGTTGAAGRDARKKFGSKGSSTPGIIGNTGARGYHARWHEERIHGEDGKEGAKGADINVFVYEPLDSNSFLELSSLGGNGSPGGSGADGVRGGKGQKGGTGGAGGKGGWGHSASSGGPGGTGGRGGDSGGAGNGGRGGKAGDSGTLRSGYGISESQYRLSNPPGEPGFGGKSGHAPPGGSGGDGGDGGLGGEGWLGGSDGSAGGYGHKGRTGREGRHAAHGRSGQLGEQGEQLPSDSKRLSNQDALEHFLKHDEPERAEKYVSVVGVNLNSFRSK